MYRAYQSAIKRYQFRDVIAGPTSTFHRQQEFQPAQRNFLCLMDAIHGDHCLIDKNLSQQDCMSTTRWARGAGQQQNNIELM